MRLEPPGSVERFVELDGGRVRVLTSGDATHVDDRLPLVLLHGGGTDNAAISWYELFATLGVARRLYAVDLPGFGATVGIAPLGAPAAMADFVARVCECLGHRRVVVMGVSMGGDVGLNLALRHPDLVSALILIAPGGLAPVFRNRLAQFAAYAVGRLPDALLLPLARLANRYVDVALRSIVSHPDRLPPEVVAEFVREATRPDAALGYLRYNQATLGPGSMRNNLLPEVSRIAVPTLFFCGADDRLVDPAGPRHAAAAMPAARLVLVPDCGHWAQLEAPDRFLAETAAFLAELDDVTGRD